MVGILITGHGHFASGIASSVELIMQSLKGVEVVDFPQGDNYKNNKQRQQNNIHLGLLTCFFFFILKKL